MKLAHTAIVTPHKAGLYETARDLVSAERKAGFDARICDPVKPHDGEDRGVPIASNFYNKADLFINHSGLSGPMNKMNKPIIHMLHGRPYSTFLLEQTGKIAVYSYWRKIAGDPRFKAFVTFWPEFIPYFANILPGERIHAITAPVDLDRWQSDGPAGYKFHGHKGKYNVVISDMWREDKDPYHVLNAVMVAARKMPDLKVHIYAAPQKGTGWGIIKALLREAGILGECVGFIQGLDNVYRAADAMLSCHKIATRSVREALACGCNVVMAPGNGYTPFQADPEDLNVYADMIIKACETKMRKQNRHIAETNFDSRKTAEEFIQIVNRVI